MTWRYVVSVDRHGWAVRELFTDDGGLSWTEDTVGPQGETPAELADDLRHMAEAFGAPILDLTLDPPRLVGS